MKLNINIQLKADDISAERLIVIDLPLSGEQFINAVESLTSNLFSTLLTELNNEIALKSSRTNNNQESKNNESTG